jgi:putative aldouronate transport system permease protein
VSSVTQAAGVRAGRRTRGTRPIWQETPHRTTVAGKGLAVGLVVALVVVPFWTVLMTSLSPSAEVIRNGGWSLWPDHFTLTAYHTIFASGIVGHAVVISVAITFVGTTLSLGATVMLAYALSRPNVLGGKPVMLGILFCFLLPAGMIPSFLIVSDMHLLNHYSALIAPVLISAFNLVILRGAFQAVPAELYEAARLDGAGEVRTMLLIALPLSKAIVAVVGFYYAVGYWNSFFNAILYLNDQNTWPLSAVLREYVIAGASSDSANASAEVLASAPQTITMATVVIATVPILCVYPFLQRYFTKGMLTGAIKS